MGHKYVYSFGDGKAEGKATMKELLGGKGANLAEMSSLKIPVPAGFTISTEVCTYYYRNGSYPPELEAQVKEALAGVDKVMGAAFGDQANPLLLSVRSGARASMPGMMDTVPARPRPARHAAPPRSGQARRPSPGLPGSPG